MPLNKPAALLFDLDGTLMDTAMDFFPTVNQLRQEHDLPPLADETIREQVSNGGRALTRLALDMEFDHAGFEGKRDRLLEIYCQHVGHASVLFPDMEAVLASCNQHQIPWGIVTNKPRLYTELLMERLAAKIPVLSSCDILVCPDDVKNTKPNPEPLFLAADKLQVKANDCWYVGDHIRDIDAGKAAEMTTFAAAFGYLEQDDKIEDWQAHHIIDSSQQLNQLLADSLN